MTVAPHATEHDGLLFARWRNTHGASEWMGADERAGSCIHCHAILTVLAAQYVPLVKITVEGKSEGAELCLLCWACATYVGSWQTEEGSP